MPEDPVFAYAQLNARVQPLDHGDRHEDPLQEALEVNGWAEVTGGGTIQEESGEISCCGIDLDLNNAKQAVSMLRIQAFLASSQMTASQRQCK